MAWQKLSPLIPLFRFNMWKNSHYSLHYPLPPTPLTQDLVNRNSVLPTPGSQFMSFTNDGCRKGIPCSQSWEDTTLLSRGCCPLRLPPPLNSSQYHSPLHRVNHDPLPRSEEHPHRQDNHWISLTLESPGQVSRVDHSMSVVTCDFIPEPMGAGMYNRTAMSHCAVYTPSTYSSPDDRETDSFLPLRSSPPRKWCFSPYYLTQKVTFFSL